MSKTSLHAAPLTLALEPALKHPAAGAVRLRGSFCSDILVGGVPCGGPSPQGHLVRSVRCYKIAVP